MICQFNFDQGGITASTKDIKSYFKMTDRDIGPFGDISFLGTTNGGIISLSVINKFFLYIFQQLFVLKYY